MTEQQNPYQYGGASTHRPARPNETPTRFLELMAKWSESDNWDQEMRELIIGEDDLDEVTAEERSAGFIQDREEAKALIEEMRTSPYHRDTLSRVALDMSLCPLHFTDYAECFEDEEPECAAIREVFPGHDT